MTPDRIKFAKANYRQELPWVRIEDFKHLVLPRPIALVNGAFDLLHSGHMKILFCARNHAKSVVCAMDSDEKLRANKLGRPILSWIERATALGFMPIDYLTEINNDEEFRLLVKLLKPDLRVQGAEYKDTISRVRTPKLLVHNSGMRTSEIVRRIKNGSN